MVNLKTVFFCQRRFRSRFWFSCSPKFQPLRCRFSSWNSSPKLKKPKIQHRCRPFVTEKIAKGFVSQEAQNSTSYTDIWNCAWQPGRAYVTSFRPTRNWREAEKPATDLASFTRSAKTVFPSDYHFIIFSGVISEFGACLVQNAMAQSVITQS